MVEGEAISGKILDPEHLQQVGVAGSGGCGEPAKGIY